MKKVKLLFCYAMIGAFLVTGCSNVDLATEDKQEAASDENTQEIVKETESAMTDTEDLSDNATTDLSAEEDEAQEADNEDNEDDVQEGDDTGDEDESASTEYRVLEFFMEEIDSVPVSIVKTGSFDDGDVYSYDIVYDEDTADCYVDSDRFHIGTFLFKEDEIYLITDTRDDHKEQDFYDYGVLVYSNEDYSREISGYVIKLHNDGYLCSCVYYYTLVETGYYAEFVFNSDKELTYYRSGYGAEADPIEITTNTEKDIENAFLNAKESELTIEDVTVTYNGFDIGPDTSYQEIIDALGYPENFEDSNNRFDSTEDGCRWRLNYPEAYGEYEISINCISPSNDPEGPDSYVDYVSFAFPTNGGVTKYDSIYSLVDVYGAPDDIREASWPKYKDVVYEFEGNELVFTITPDNTVAFFKIDFAE